MRPITAVALALALAACQPQAPDGAPAPPPADAPPEAAAPAPAPAPAATLPAELSGDLDAVGTEPFWALKVRGGAMTLSRPDQPDASAPAAAAKMEGDTAVWTGDAGGKPLVAKIWKGACSDGMSDRSFPLIAEVRLGDLMLDGCAAKAGETPKGE